MIKVREVLSEETFPLWIERHEIWEVEMTPATMDNMEMHSAYSVVDGAYCGAVDQDPGTFKFFDEHGIKPQKKRPDSNNCSIGYSETEDKWYGWSHRAIFGFGVGSEVKIGDCAYQPPDKPAFIAWAREFWSGDNHEDITAKEETRDGLPGILVRWRYDETTPNPDIIGKYSEAFHPFPEEFGRGEWTAETLDDAKAMAIDFADSVA